MSPVFRTTSPIPEIVAQRQVIAGTKRPYVREWHSTGLCPECQDNTVDDDQN